MATAEIIIRLTENRDRDKIYSLFDSESASVEIRRVSTNIIAPIHQSLPTKFHTQHIHPMNKAKLQNHILLISITITFRSPFAPNHLH